MIQKTLDEDKIIRKLSLVSLLGNTALSGFKMVAGIVGHSSAMISDSIHSFSDVLTTLIAWIGVRISKKDADEDHPYGHERFECVASLLLGLLLLCTGLIVGKSGVDNIRSGSYATMQVPTAIALFAAILSIGTKEAMYWYTRHYAKLINSAAFMADAWHHRSDALSSVGSLIGIAGAMLGFPIMDSLASLIICVFILKVSYDIIMDSMRKMLDTSCGLEYDEKLKDFIVSQEDVHSVDMLHTRMFGNKVYVDLEIGVDGNLKLRAAHSIAERVHENVEKNFPEIKHIMIHVNPAE